MAGCKLCGGEVEPDEGMLVCVSCGAIAEDKDVLRIDEYQPDGMKDPSKTVAFNGAKVSSAIKVLHLQTRKFETKGKQNAKKFLDTMMANLSLSSDLKHDVMQLYEKSLSGKYYFSWHTTRTILAAVCLYVKVCESNMPATVTEVCNAARIEKDEFARVFYCFLKTYPTLHTKPDGTHAGHVVSHILRDFDFHRAESSQIFERTARILDVQKQLASSHGCTNIEGRSPVRYMIASSYIAWKTLNMNERRRLPFANFAKSNGLPPGCSKSVQEAVAVLLRNFMVLASKISWLKFKNITKDTVLLYFDDIMTEAEGGVVHMLKFEALEGIRKAPHVPLVRPEVPVLDENDDLDISDSEIDKYIRSSDEVRLLEKAKSFSSNDITDNGKKDMRDNDLSPKGGSAKRQKTA
ncbi:Transcription factor IIIB 50 kDa subunit [Halotydeus destructor]|nr:Transcription factor IIIB 50 kDa subunit [Halotydeus destructor]